MKISVRGRVRLRDLLRGVVLRLMGKAVEVEVFEELDVPQMMALAQQLTDAIEADCRAAVVEAAEAIANGVSPEEERS